MKLEFLTQNDPLYLLPFFEEFFRHYASDFEVVQVSACRVMGKRPRRQLLLELAWLYGLGFPRLLGRLALARVLGFIPRSRDAARFHTLVQLCNACGIPYQEIGNPNTAEFVNAARARQTDLIVSVACPYILKEPLLGLFRHGCVNIHHAPLPRYKGMMPTFWQMYHGEKKVGITIHYMAVKVDEGVALLQDEIEIAPGESLHQLIRRSKRHGAHCLAQVLRQIAAGTQRALTLDHAKASYFTFPTLGQIREFRRRGFRAI
jgi:methionyl-tRNA formyltransferase